MYNHGRKTGCRLSLDYTYRGMRVAFLENDLIQVGVLIDKGADIFEFTYKPRSLDFMWQSPIELRKPFIATSALPEGAFHDYYYGGWQEILPSAGWNPEPYLGAFQGQHGELSLLPFEASIVENTPEIVTLKVWARLYRSPLALERWMTLKKDIPALFIHERLVNEAPIEFAVMWGHHPALGAPFLDESCVLETPAKKVEVFQNHPNGIWEPGGDYDYPLAPDRRSGMLADIRQVRPASTRSVDVLFLKDLEEGRFIVRSERLRLGFGMSWDASLFKYLWMWQVYAGHDGWPWYGRTYNLALEPFTSYPSAGISTAIQNGSALLLQPNQVIETDLAAAAFEF